MRFTDINDGHQKLQENNFWGKSPIDSADSPCVKKVAEIALSRTVLEINMLLRLMQKFKMAAKSGGKAIFEKSLQFTFQVPCMSKNLVEISHRFRDKFIHFHVLCRNSRWPPQMVGKFILRKNHHLTHQKLCGSKIASKLFNLTLFLR